MNIQSIYKNVYKLSFSLWSEKVFSKFYWNTSFFYCYGNRKPKTELEGFGHNQNLSPPLHTIFGLSFIVIDNKWKSMKISWSVQLLELSEEFQVNLKSKRLDRKQSTAFSVPLKLPMLQNLRELGSSCLQLDLAFHVSHWWRWQCEKRVIPISIFLATKYIYK